MRRRVDSQQQQADLTDSRRAVARGGITASGRKKDQPTHPVSTAHAGRRADATAENAARGSRACAFEFVCRSREGVVTERCAGNDSSAH